MSDSKFQWSLDLLDSSWKWNDHKLNQWKEIYKIWIERMDWLLNPIFTSMLNKISTLLNIFVFDLRFIHLILFIIWIYRV